MVGVGWLVFFFVMSALVMLVLVLLMVRITVGFIVRLVVLNVVFMGVFSVGEFSFCVLSVGVVVVGLLGSFMMFLLGVFRRVLLVMDITVVSIMFFVMSFLMMGGFFMLLLFVMMMCVTVAFVVSLVMLLVMDLFFLLLVANWVFNVGLLSLCIMMVVMVVGVTMGSFMLLVVHRRVLLVMDGRWLLLMNRRILLVVDRRMFLVMDITMAMIVFLMVRMYLLVLDRLFWLFMMDWCSYLHWGLLVLDGSLSGSSLHGLCENRAFCKFSGLVHDGLVLGVDLLLVAFLQVHTDLVVDERKDHAVMDGNQVRWLVFSILLGRLHEDEGAISGHLVLALFRDAPALLLGVGDVAVIGGNSLELDLNFALHGATNREVVLGHCFKDDFLLDQVLIFIRADPGWAGSEGWRVLSRVVFNNILVALRWTHDVEPITWSLVWLFSVSNLVEVVVHNFTKIDQRVLLNLNFSLLVDLNSRGVHDTQVTDEVLAVLADDHELAFPQLLVVRDLVVVGLTFADLENALGAINGNSEVLEFLSVNSLESHMKLVSSGLVWQGFEDSALQIALNLELMLGEFLELAGLQVLVLAEGLELGVL
jgi:hypothetical protein